MSSNYETIKNEQGKIEGFFSRFLPGYKGYKQKEMRREADRMLRDALVRDFGLQLNRLAPIQDAILSNGGIEWMDDIGAIKTALQTLIDRIDNAAMGYAGFFDAVRVKEDDLDRLEQFDQQLVAEIQKISGAIDGIEKVAESPADLKSAISSARKMVRETNDLFTKRSSAITGM